MRGHMGGREAGMYLQGLREAMGLSRVKAASRLQTSKSEIERIDNGMVDPRSRLFLRYGRLVGANMRRLIALLLDEPPVDEEAFWDDFDRLTPQQQDAVIEIMRQMIGDE